MIAKLDSELAQHGFCVEDIESRSVLKMQSGLVRTNCLDSLDRTNVGQSKIGIYAL